MHTKKQPKKLKQNLETKEVSSSLSLSLLKKLLRRLVLLLRQSLSKSVPNPAEQADPALVKFLTTGICFVIMDVRENLQPGVRAILLKEDSIENLRDSALTSNLFTVFVPLISKFPNSAFQIFALKEGTSFCHASYRKALLVNACQL